MDQQIQDLLSVADWRITSVCNMDCPYCFGPKDIPHLPLIETMKLADFLMEIGVEGVCLTGGEPLLHPDIGIVMNYLHDRGIKLLLSTNGSYFREFRDVITDCVARLSLPLDGYCAGVHARAGRTRKHYYSVLSILESLRGHRPYRIKIGTVVSALNVASRKNLYKIYELLLNYPIDQWKIYEFIPEGKSAGSRDSLVCPNGSFERAVDELLNKAQSTPFAIDIRRRQQRNRGYFLLQPNGDVIMPSDERGAIVEHVLGNALRDPAESILRDWQSTVDLGNYAFNPRLIL